MKLILCLICGTVGVHKFLEKKILLGIVYIFTFGLFGIGILVDTIHYVVEIARMDKSYEEEYDDFDEGYDNE